MESSSSTTERSVRRLLRTYCQEFKRRAFVTMSSSRPLVRSYLFLRAGVGVIGVLLPVALVVVMMLWDFRLEVWDSMSSYYYTAMRDVFVGSFWAIAIFLISYRYDPLDNIVSDIAGVCAIGLSLFPTTPGAQATDRQKFIGMVHVSFAAVFLIALFVMVFFLFTRGNPKKEATEAEKVRKRRNNLIYRICGILMAAGIVFAALTLFVPYLSDEGWHHQYHPILIAEFIATEAFGIAWFVKGETLGMMKAAARRLPFIWHAKSGQSATPSQPAVDGQ